MEPRIQWIEVRRVYDVATLPAGVKAPVDNNELVEHIKNVRVHSESIPSVSAKFDIVRDRNISLRKGRSSSKITALCQNDLRYIVDVNE